jgi:hypothetical protein
MPDDRNLSVRDAGNRIAAAGLADDVIQVRAEQITQRRGRQREAAEDDADDDARPVRKQPKDERKQKPPRLPEDDDEYSREELEEEHDAGNFDDEDADDGSNREDGDEDEGEDGAEDHEDGDEDDAATSDDDREYTVKIDGKEYSVPVKELVAGYQRNRDYQNKTQALANAGRNLTAGHQKVAQTYTRKLQQANAVIGEVRNLLIGDVNSQEMAALRVQDPAKWAVQRQVMADRIAQVDSVLQQIHQEHERHTAEYTATQNAARNATLDQERALLHQAIPDWGNGGAERLARYLASAGFKAAELEGVTDARMLSVAEKARKWDALQAAKKQPVTKKAKPTPRAPARPGQGQIRKGAAQTTARRREFDSAKSKAKKTGDMRDAGKAISRLL